MEINNYGELALCVLSITARIDNVSKDVVYLLICVSFPQVAHYELTKHIKMHTNVPSLSELICDLASVFWA